MNTLYKLKLSLHFWFSTIFFGLSVTLFSCNAYAISYVTNQSATSNSATSLTVKVSTSTAINDVLIAQISIGKNSGCSPALITPPAGWMLVKCDSTSAGSVTQAIYYKVAISTDIGKSYIWTKPSSTAGLGIILVYRGVDILNPIDTPTPTGRTFSSTKSATANDISGMSAGAKAITLVASNDNTRRVFTPPSGWTEHLEKRCSSSCSSLAMTASSKDYATGGATSGVTTSLKNNASGVVQLLALRPSTTTLVGYYPLDGSFWLDDNSPYGFDAAVQGTASNGSGKVCTGLTANGSGWLEVPDPSTGELDFTGNAYTISAWVYPTSYPSSGNYRTIISKETLYRLDINSSGKLVWTWNATSASGTARSVTSSTTIPLNQWTHIAVVFDKNASSSRQKIYITASGAGAVTQDATTANNIDSLWNSSKKLFIGATEGASRNFIGQLDEVRLYAGAQTSAQLSTDYLSSHGCGVDHYRININNGTGSICGAGETITVVACADAGTASTCTPYTGIVSNVYLTPNDANWVNGASSVRPLSISGGIGSEDYDLSAAAVVTYGFDTAAATPNPAPTNASNKYRCFVSSGEVALSACKINFVATSVTIDLALNNITACKNESAGALDVGLCSGATLPTTQDVTFGFTYVDPVAGTKATTISGVGTGATTKTITAGSTQVVKLVLDATNQNYPFVINYPDAGKLNLTASATVSGATGTDNTNIISSPYNLQIISPTTNCSASPVTNCSVYKAAGESFPMTVRATCDPSYSTPNAGTPNFRLADIPLSADPVAPTPNAGSSPTFSFDSSTNSNGEVTFNTSVSEVGVFNFTAAKDGINYLIDGNVAGIISGNIGRFRAHHFDTAVSEGACTDTFTYSGQPFETVVTARNAANAQTLNYDSTGFSKNLTISAVGATGTVSGGDISPPSALFQTSHFSSGITDTLTPAFTFSTAKTSPATIGVRATDADGATSNGYIEGSLPIRSGRIYLQNTYGSELLNLPIPLETQYWNGSSYARNLLDNCSAIAASGIAMGSYKNNLAACETQVGYSSGAGAFVNGVSNFLRLTKPGATNSGSVDLTINLNGASGSTCTSASSSAATNANMSWLGTNPVSRATFGIYKSPIIYLRENY